MVHVRGPEAFARVLQVALDLLAEGKASGISAHYDPTGIGRVAVSTIDGQDVPLPGLPAAEEETTTPAETPSSKAAQET